MQRPGHDPSRARILQRPRLRDSSRMQERSSRSLLANVLELDDNTSLRLENGSSGISIKIDDCNEGGTFRTELLAILKELRRITGKYKKDEDDMDIRSEWKFAAMVIDRLCFWICVTFTVVSTVTVLMSAPQLMS